jgi:epoxyqueuosine reductase
VEPDQVDDHSLLAQVRDAAAALGLTGPAVAAAEPPPGAGDALAEWLDRGYHGEMAYMDRLGRDRADPAHWAEWSRSVALFADSYLQGPPCSTDPAQAAISRYARGRDYHTVLKDKLRRLADRITAAGFRALPFVDSSPLMEKALAARGGLGWIGKNGNLLHSGRGSFFFLGGLVTDAVWPPDQQVEDECGTCDICITSCPTGAIVAPGVIDARRCISYLTIELKGAIPRDLRPMLGNRVFGCDDCQDVCPFNAGQVHDGDPAYAGADTDADLLALASLDAAAFRRRFFLTPIWRARYRGFLRNLMVALGNWGSESARAALTTALTHPEPLVREHAAWGLGRIGDDESRTALQHRAAAETDTDVAREIDLSLAESAGLTSA